MLKGKSAVVTGSTSGIGLGVTEALAARGVNIMLMNGLGNGTDIEGLRSRIAGKYGVTVLYDGADMSKPETIAAMMVKAAAVPANTQLCLEATGPVY